MRSNEGKRRLVAINHSPLTTNHPPPVVKLIENIYRLNANFITVIN